MNGSDPDVDDLTPVGSFVGSASRSGTLDQGGNVYEWIDDNTREAGRFIRGGSFLGGTGELVSSFRIYSDPRFGGDGIGLRLVLTPEPSTGLLVIAGLLGLAVGVQRETSRVYHPPATSGGLVYALVRARAFCLSGIDAGLGRLVRVDRLASRIPRAVDARRRIRTGLCVLKIYLLAQAVSRQAYRP